MRVDELWRQEPLESRQEGLLRELRSFFRRQGLTVAALLALGLVLTNAWDGERWDRELRERLLRWTTPIALLGAQQILDRFAPGEGFSWSEARLREQLVLEAARAAGAINNTTYNQLEAARAAGRPVGEVFLEAQGLRAPQQVETLSTSATNLGQGLAANPVGLRSKTWRVTSRNPRPSHARLDGETVALEDRFSNGMRWPADQAAGLGPEESANCACICDYSFLEPRA